MGSIAQTPVEYCDVRCRPDESTRVRTWAYQIVTPQRIKMHALCRARGKGRQRRISATTRYRTMPASWTFWWWPWSTTRAFLPNAWRACANGCADSL